MPPPPFRRPVITVPRFQLPSGSVGRIVLSVVGILVLLILAFGSFYTVPNDSVGVVLRCGGYLGTTEPGLRFKLPLVDRRIILPQRRQLKMEFGFSTRSATNEYQAAAPDEQPRERSMITGDRNAASVEWVVQYRIDDPFSFLFHVRNPEATLRDVSESVMREVVGDRTVDELLTIGRQKIEEESLLKLGEFSKRYSLGLRIDQVQLKNVDPPPQVQASFNEVNQSQQERERMINEARGQYNRAVPRARGEADKLVAEAEGEAIRRVNEADGDATRFQSVFGEYHKAPEITRQRLYLESMTRVLPSFRKRILMDDKQKGILPFLQLDTPVQPQTPASR